MADLSIGSDPPPDQKHDRIVSKATYADFKIDVSQLPDNMYTVSVSIKAAAASFKILKD